MAGELTPELQEQLKAINEKIGGLEQSNTNLAKENASLKEELKKLASSGPADAEAEKEPTIPEEAFTVAKKKYKFNLAKFSIPGIGDVTATDCLADDTKHKALGDKSIKQWLVENEAGVIDAVGE